MHIFLKDFFKAKYPAYNYQRISNINIIIKGFLFKRQKLETYLSNTLIESCIGRESVK